MLVFDITGTYTYTYAVYEPEVYDNVRIDVSVTNRGDNTNNVSLLLSLHLYAGGCPSVFAALRALALLPLKSTTEATIPAPRP